METLPNQNVWSNVERQMPDRSFDLFSLVMYALAAISGGIGGCAIAGHHVLRGQPMRLSYILAYAIVGSTFGILMLSYGALFGLAATSLDSLIGHSLLAGAAGSLVLASTNLTARMVLKRLGMEVLVTVRRADEERRTDGEKE
jgi:hypothetical protein